jgi:gliding motility-associated protein GldM
MIGMMYLVLTALLALNVSKEILNSFIVVEESLNTTNENFEGKNGMMYNKFKQALETQKSKAQHPYENAMKAKKYAQELTDSIDAIKGRLYRQLQEKSFGAGSKTDTFHLKYLDSKDNYDDPTRIMIGTEPETPTGAAVGLKKQIDDFKKKMTALVENPKDKAGLKLGLNTDEVYSVAEEKKVTWIENNFYHNPAAAVFSILAKLKTDVRNAEGDVLQNLLKAISDQDQGFDQVDAKVVAESNYITLGEEYHADIFVAAHNSASDPAIFIGKVDASDPKHPKLVGNGEKVSVEGGVGKFVTKPGAQGDQHYEGIISVTNPNTREVTSYKFENDYKVAAPSFAVSPTKMNVLYIGVDNPVDISVAGAASNDIVPSISGLAGGSIKATGGGHFVVNMTTPGECDINVSIKQKNGSKSMGKQHFRVKKVPSPNAKFAGVVSDGSASLSELQSAPGVVPDLQDFVFDLKFPVLSWKMSGVVNGLFIEATANGPATSGDQKSLLQKIKKGGRVLIEEVYVQAPEGKRHINGVNIKVK